MAKVAWFCGHWHVATEINDNHKGLSWLSGCEPAETLELTMRNKYLRSARVLELGPPIVRKMLVKPAVALFLRFHKAANSALAVVKYLQVACSTDDKLN